MPAGTLRHARRYHSAALLPDGRVLILGGIDEQERLVDVVEKFDVGSGRSETVPLTWHSRSGHTATLLDSTRVLVAGGAIDGRPASDIEIINMADWHAVSLASLERARRGHAAALLADGRVELVGGEGTEGPLGELRTVINVAKRVVRPITTTHADSSTVTTTYDAGNRPTQVDDSVGGTITRQYDLSDRLTSETTPEGTISYTYDALDRRATMTVAGQAAVSYDYDAGSRLTAIMQGSSSVTFAYDSADRRTSLTLPNGIIVGYDYDNASQLTGLTYTLGSTTLGSVAYTLDGTGRRTGVGGSWARTGLPSALTAATYDAANQVTTWDGVSLTHDANGNLTNDGSRTFTWDVRDQLASLSGPVTASFLYDALGRRRARTVGNSTIGFLYDGLDAAQELSNGNPTVNILSGLEVDEVFTRTDASGTRNVLADGLGSTLSLSDASGLLQTHYTYQPFGATTTTGSSDSNSTQFSGRENDGTTLYYYRARYYDPRLQRFISQDPLDFAGGVVNLYGYAAQAPTVFRDPSGLFFAPYRPSQYCQKHPWGCQAIGYAADVAGAVIGAAISGGGVGGGARGLRGRAAASGGDGAGERPPSMAPPEARRQGALRVAKRQNGIPTSQQLSKVRPNVDRSGNRQPGRIYEYEVPKPGGGTRTIQIRDDAAGHSYPDNPSQNRGPHFNDPAGNHYDYKK